jgi:hypothetical protein
MKWHVKVLAGVQQRVLRRLGPVLTAERFYLAGGTAVAAHCGHRGSIDLDWFTRKNFDPLRLAGLLRDKDIDFRIDRIDQGTLHGRVSRVRVSLLEYRYRLLAEAGPWHRMECDVASLDDLAAMKLAALAQRGAKKDFVDLYALGKRLGLAAILDCYRRKFSIADLGHVLMSLTYFDDADRERMPRMLWNVDWRTIKRALRHWVRDLTPRPDSAIER